MAQLTGQQTGTAENDIFFGDFDFDVVADVAGEGIVDATISTLAGDDRVEGRAVLVPMVEALTVSGVGIADSTIETGSGDDTVLATGFGARFFEGFSIRGPIYNGTGISYGVFNSLIDAGAGNDVLTFAAAVEGDGFEQITGDSFGLFDSVVESGSGADAIAISGKVGLIESTLSAGAQQDTIEIVAISDQAATGIDRSVILGDGDADSIAINAVGVGDVTAALSSQLVGGSGNDAIALAATAGVPSINNGFSDTATAVGADATTLIQGFSGDDTISLSASADSATAFAYGAREARIGGGIGADAITLSAENSGLGGEAFGALNTFINAGAGDDVITLAAQSITPGSLFAGASGSTIRGGSGDDTMLFVARSGVFDAFGSAGLIDSSVLGGSGNDRFEVQLVSVPNTTNTFADYGIVDGLLGGGSGNDTFDVGIGDGTLTGGEGNDLAVVSYFDAETMRVDAIANGVRISGSQTNNGEAGAWRQDIVDVESLLVGTTAYTVADFVTAFG